jgi:hypothetical protein
MGKCILDMMLDTARLQYLHRLCRSHKPEVNAFFVVSELAFELTKAPYSTKKSKHLKVVQASAGLEFLKKARCILVDVENGGTKSLSYIEEEFNINTKDTVIDVSAVLTQDKLLL